ncbi:hypothetical protein [Gluconobacter cerinus]|uniref:hypothetical protein n=1 Tax=Gluconobacter cerinus TaxID=38307 RepID=UPI001B8A8EA5|nr:hypothetical protein [Gluconobacter cerinus]MBS1038114.1 hypothetical protein [Gluconobacter cerinus]
MNNNFYNTKQDWEILSTDGHVRGHRLNFTSFIYRKISRRLRFTGLALSIFGATGLIALTPVPEAIAKHFESNPAHFASVPGVDGKVGYELTWASSLPVSDGLTSQQYKDLISSTKADYQAHQGDAKSYEAIGRLIPKPLLTRPEKALETASITRGDGSTSSNADMLKNGIVTVPDTDAPFAFSVLADVAGKLSFSEFGAFGCQYFGEKVEGCTELKTPDSLEWFKPGYISNIGKQGFVAPPDFSRADDKNTNLEQLISELNNQSKRRN